MMPRCVDAHGDHQTGQESGRTKGEVKTQLIAHDQEVCVCAPCCAVLCRAVLCYAVLCCARRAVLCCAATLTLCAHIPWQVYDISFAKGRDKFANTFATVGADGSIRMFDLR